MNLFEFEGKGIFKRKGIRVPEGRYVLDSEELMKIKDEIEFPCVVKAQVLEGGRWKKGLIRIADSLLEAKNFIEHLLIENSKINGFLIEKTVNWIRELYVSITYDPEKSCLLLISSSEGGVDIESIARDNPSSITKECLDINLPFLPYHARNSFYSLNLGVDLKIEWENVIRNMLDIFLSYDAELVEINPLFVDDDKKLIAGDAKISIDDRALFRQSWLKIGKERFNNDIEYEAFLLGMPFYVFDGDIGLMCAGAGLTNTVFDLVHDFSGSVASYCEFGGPNYMKAEKAMELSLKISSKVILIVTFGTFARADIMADGVIKAIESLKPDRPIITCIRGTGEDKAFDMLKKAGLNPLLDTEVAVKEAIKLCEIK